MRELLLSAARFAAEFVQVLDLMGQTSRVELKVHFVTKSKYLVKAMEKQQILTPLATGCITSSHVKKSVVTEISIYNDDLFEYLMK